MKRQGEGDGELGGKLERRSLDRHPVAAMGRDDGDDEVAELRALPIPSGEQIVRRGQSGEPALEAASNVDGYAAPPEALLGQALDHGERVLTRRLSSSTISRKCRSLSRSSASARRLSVTSTAIPT